MKTPSHQKVVVIDDGSIIIIDDGDDTVTIA